MLRVWPNKSPRCASATPAKFCKSERDTNGLPDTQSARPLSAVPGTAPAVAVMGGAELEEPSAVSAEAVACPDDCGGFSEAEASSAANAFAASCASRSFCSLLSFACAVCSVLQRHGTLSV